MEQEKNMNHIDFIPQCNDCIHNEVCYLKKDVMNLKEKFISQLKTVYGSDAEMVDRLATITQLNITINHRCDKYHPKPCEVATTGVYAAGGNRNTNLGRPTYSSHNVGGSIRAGDGGFDLGLPLPEGYSRPVPMYVKPCATSNIDRKPF